MKKLALIVLALIAPVAHAGPFGLEKGMRLEAVQRVATLKQVEPYVYSTPRLPESHPIFKDFRLIITPNHGLCKFVAWSDGINTSVYGDELRQVYDNIYSALERKYGSNLKFDHLNAGSIWDERRDWMMGLYKKERTLSTYWDEEEKSSLSDQLQAVTLKAIAVSQNVGLISVTYEFDNAASCLDFVRQTDNSAL